MCMLVNVLGERSCAPVDSVAVNNFYIRSKSRKMLQNEKKKNILRFLLLADNAYQHSKANINA